MIPQHLLKIEIKFVGDNLVATRYEFLQSPHLFIYPISASLQECNINSFKDANYSESNQFFDNFTILNYKPFLIGCEPLQHEISLQRLIHELVSLARQIQTQHPVKIRKK